CENCRFARGPGGFQSLPRPKSWPGRSIPANFWQSYRTPVSQAVLPGRRGIQSAPVRTSLVRHYCLNLRRQFATLRPMPVFNLSRRDLLLILLSFAVVLVIGIRVAASNDGGTEDYFLAGRTMIWPFVGISLFAS